MARITVQTDDERTVLEERDVHVHHIRQEPAASHLIERLARAVQDAERPPARKRAVRRLVSIVPVRDYKLVGA
jgi:N-formylglutamate amidohydrolase